MSRRIFPLVFSWLTAFILIPEIAAAGDNIVKLILTSNLNGRFSTSIENQDKEDPMLLMAQSLIGEQKNKPADLFLDLGNAFYPGLLSRFSYGSVMMDFLEYFGCAASLVASEDLNIGVSNLEFLEKGQKKLLLSANIVKNGAPVFTPYFIFTLKGQKFAFIGITSEKGFLDIAEKQVLDVTLKDPDTVLDGVIDELLQQHVDYMVLLSGRSYSDNLALMEKYKKISLCISGGDATGALYSAKAQRVDLDSGRSLVTLTHPDGYYTLTLSAEKSLVIDSLKCNIPAYTPTGAWIYKDFVNRLTLWKERFAQEGNETIAENILPVSVDDARVADVLRDRFKTEIVILEKDSILPGTLSGRVTYSDILKLVGNGYPIFTYKISGKELKQVVSGQEGLIISGTDGKQVQGYPIDDKRQYLICSPQSVYDRLAKQLNREIKYKNTWKTISAEIRDDLKGNQSITYTDFSYLDDRFRILVDVWLSNFYDQSNVSRGENIDVPPGKPSETYHKWGLEDKIDFTIYNQFHKLVFTPYVFYMRQDESYLQNLLRGTLLYTYNLSPLIKPYYKSQVDTVIQIVDNFRPVLVRETTGASFETEHVTGKFGLGFEKQTQDPQEPLFSGIETIVDAKYDFLENFTYNFDLDSFYSIKNADFSKHQLRMEITNALCYKLNSFLAFSLKHKWFYFYSLEYEEKYRDSQVLLTFDLKTDFKIF